MFSRLVQTSNSYTLLITRLVLGVLFFAHGAQKLLGWFGGSGYTTTMAAFASMGIPPILAFLAIMCEFAGGLALIVGVLSRIAAAGIVVNMLVAIATVHMPNGLFMNWTGIQSGEGFEYHLLAIAAGLSIIVHGAGMLSVDRMIWNSMQPGSKQLDRTRRAA